MWRSWVIGFGRRGTRADGAVQGWAGPFAAVRDWAWSFAIVPMIPGSFHASPVMCAEGRWRVRWLLRWVRTASHVRISASRLGCRPIVRPSSSAISGGTRCKARYIVHITPTRLADAVSIERALRGLCDRGRLLDFVENFVAFEETKGGLVKKVAQNHQYIGVNRAIARMRELRATEPDAAKRLGVFWHTQGSGKSLSMVFFTEKIHRKLAGKWTFSAKLRFKNALRSTIGSRAVMTRAKNAMADRPETQAAIRTVSSPNQARSFKASATPLTTKLVGK